MLFSSKSLNQSCNMFMKLRPFFVFVGSSSLNNNNNYIIIMFYNCVDIQANSLTQKLISSLHFKFWATAWCQLHLIDKPALCWSLTWGLCSQIYYEGPFITFPSLVHLSKAFPDCTEVCVLEGLHADFLDHVLLLSYVMTHCVTTVYLVVIIYAYQFCFVKWNKNIT